MEHSAVSIFDREQIYAQHPDFPWLCVDDCKGVEAFLRDRSWLADEERVQRCTSAGEGNMNVTMRVTTSRRSIIVKQSRPWVQKYDHIPAPWDRVEYEHRFYQRVRSIPDVASRMPDLLHADMAARVLVLEDLGNTAPLMTLYTGESLHQPELQQLARFLAALHESTRDRIAPSFENREMRRLNHQHIFEVPLDQENDLDLDELEPGLAAAAASLRGDVKYRRMVSETGQQYLADGPALVHGDFFPGSWLRVAQDVFVIDPEFCFFGDAEFDLGCAIGHFCLSSQPRHSAEAFLRAYIDYGDDTPLDLPLLSRYAAAEVMRRLIGVAQLPLNTRPPWRAQLLRRSQQAMITENWEELFDDKVA